MAQPVIWDFPCNESLILPLINEGEWSREFRAVLYCIGLLYSFLGVAIAADVFMTAIEKITSTTKKVPIDMPTVNENGDKISLEQQYREVSVWNPTVANLTLMALGSSAPEILLSIIEIVGNDFKSGALGPSTIVGSAAFNLLVITGVCIVSIPTGDTRRIKELGVFIVTASFATFAYIWLIIILIVSSKGVVEVWEGALTLAFFGILVGVAYLLDSKPWQKRKKKEELTEEDEEEAVPLQDLAEGSLYWKGNEKRTAQWHEVEKQVMKEYPGFTADELAGIVAARMDYMRPHDRLYYRIRAAKWLGGCVRSMSSIEEQQAKLSKAPSMSQSQMSLSGGTGEAKAGVVEFEAKTYGFKAGTNLIHLRVIRRYRTHKKLIVRYNTVNGSAKKIEHYLPKEDSLVFQPGETEKSIQVQINENGPWEENQAFYVRLHVEEGDEKTIVGFSSPAKIRYQTIEDEPRVTFRSKNFSVKESDAYVRLPIERRGDVDASLTIQIDTKEETATEDKDFDGIHKQITMLPGEVVKFLPVRIIDDMEEEKSETFRVQMSNVEGGDLGGQPFAIVTILSDDGVKDKISQLKHMVPMMLDDLEPGAKSWKEQFKAATSVNGGDTENATMRDIIMHILAFPWKVGVTYHGMLLMVIFAFVPPPSMAGGWLTFVVALMMIGLLTAIVGDLASIFGCLVNLKDEVTAITFVALGTSLPDTFASRLAAVQEATADNSIGNITGSNSVNVFLGLGLPWLIASIYWESKGLSFDVPPGALGFSVLVYTVVSLLCIALLVVRRNVAAFGKAELGGPVATKWICAIFCVLLWVTYVVLSSLQSYRIINVQF